MSEALVSLTSGNPQVRASDTKERSRNGIVMRCSRAMCLISSILDRLQVLGAVVAVGRGAVLSCLAFRGPGSAERGDVDGRPSDDRCSDSAWRLYTSVQHPLPDLL